MLVKVGLAPLIPWIDKTDGRSEYYVGLNASQGILLPQIEKTTTDTLYSRSTDSLQRKNRKQSDYINGWYFCRIGYNIEMACILYSKFLKEYDYDYRIAAAKYGFGGNHSSFRAVVKNPEIIWDEKYKYYKFIRVALK